jgi:peptide subunit release factor 1 (eRF1)
VVAQSPLLHKQLRDITLTSVDIADGGTCGFNQAINLAAGVLGEIPVVKQRELVAKFFEQIALVSVYFLREISNLHAKINCFGRV